MRLGPTAESGGKLQAGRLDEVNGNYPRACDIRFPGVAWSIRMGATSDNPDLSLLSGSFNLNYLLKLNTG